MKACPECRTQLPDQANFCWNCGLALGPYAPAVPRPAAPPAPPPAPSQADPEPDFSHFPRPAPLSARDKRVRFGGSLPERMRRLGVVQGRTYEEIVEVMGPPTSLSSVGGGLTLAQWMRTGVLGSAHYSLVFTATTSAAASRTSPTSDPFGPRPEGERFRSGTFWALAGVSSRRGRSHVPARGWDSR